MCLSQFRLWSSLSALYALRFARLRQNNQSLTAKDAKVAQDRKELLKDG